MPAACTTSAGISSLFLPHLLQQSRIQLQPVPLPAIEAPPCGLVQFSGNINPKCPLAVRLAVWLRECLFIAVVHQMPAPTP